MNWVGWIAIGVVAAGVLAFSIVALVRWLSTGPGGDPLVGLGWNLVRLYNRFMHRPTYVGLEHVPPTNESGPLVVVSNHTAGVDPLLIQAACRFDIRFMMAKDYMTPEMMWLWKWRRLIPVERAGRDSGPAREAIRHVKDGGAIGVFPEGGIERPRNEIRPFMPGVGLIIARTKAPVLLVWVSDTPDSESAFGSLRKRSRSRIEFIGRFTFEEGRSAQEITEWLRTKLAEASGWSLNQEPLPSARKRPPEETE